MEWIRVRVDVYIPHRKIRLNLIYCFGVPLLVVQAVADRNPLH